MTRLLIGLGIFLTGWGAFVLVTGDFVATVDIAAGLVASGIGVIALSAVVRSLDRIAGLLAESNEQRVSLMSARPAGERPRVPAQPPMAEPTPLPVERRPPPSAHPQIEPIERPQPVERPPVMDRPPQPEPERRPEPSTEPRRPPAPAAAEAGPRLIREGIIDGQHYRFFEDGSIEAEGPAGLRRFRSIEEAREQIMRDRATQPPQAPAQQVQPPLAQPAGPAAADSRRPPEGSPPQQRPPRVPADTEAGPQAGGKPQELTWDAYLSGGRKSEGDTPRVPEDDQWSEPFRMLLRGDVPPADPKPPKR